MSQPYLGEIRIFGFNFAAFGWAFCNGQLVPIDQNEALFAVIGTTYGGDGQSTFALPNLQDRTAVGMGQGSGLSNWQLGQIGGENAHTLNSNEIPQHNHVATAADGVSFADEKPSPTATSYLGRLQAAQVYATSANTILAAPTISTYPGGQPHNNIQPVLVMNYCIAMDGIFPSQN